MNKTVRKPVIRLRTLNHVLSGVVIALSLYIVLTPFLPAIGFWWGNMFAKDPPLVAANDETNPNRPSETIPDENTIVIPRLRMQQPILDGPDFGTLAKGLWHRPQTATPDQPGNTVIVGHRFTYTEPNGPFYHLDKVQQGDKIIVYWNQKKHVYTVEKTFVVPAAAVEVEEQTGGPRLTLYTCTPLLTAKDRLVVQANIAEQTP